MRLPARRRSRGGSPPQPERTAERCGTARRASRQSGRPSPRDLAPSTRARSRARARPGRRVARGGAGRAAADRAVSGRRADYDDIARYRDGLERGDARYLHQLSCEDPLTGLASLATCAAVSRSSTGAAPRRGRRQDTHALVVADLPTRRHEPVRRRRPVRRATAPGPARRGRPHRVPRRETIGRLGTHRIVVVAARRPAGPPRGDHAQDAARLDGPPGSGSRASRATDAGAAALLDELAPTLSRRCRRRADAASLTACAVATPPAGAPRT